jgi:hypothetical protein
MSSYLPSLAEDASDKDSNPVQRRKSINAVAVSPHSQRKASGTCSQS